MGATLRVGDVEILGIGDLATPPYARRRDIWPSVDDEEWTPFERRFPEVFDDGHNHVGAFLIRASRRLVLVDTGIGRELGGALLDVLAAAGVTLSDIDTVFLTHLHLDHVGEIVAEDGAPTLPRNLRHEVRRIPPPPCGMGRATAARHTRASRRERAIVLGDVLLHQAQVTEPDWVSRMDMDAAAARLMRRRIVDRVEAVAMTMAAGHVRGIGFGRIARENGCRHWHAVEPERESR